MPEDRRLALGIATASVFLALFRGLKSDVHCAGASLGISFFVAAFRDLTGSKQICCPAQVEIFGGTVLVPGAVVGCLFCPS